MKRSFLYMLCIVLLGITLHLPGYINAQPARTVSLQVFYDQLEPFGQWIEDPDYGYVWMPDVDADFRPYFTNGYWVMTEFGNTWVSMYNWGWAPFHYGRWIYNPYYGWLWVPGYEWGPAWVCWRNGGGYYGWAPIGPWFAVTINFTTYNCPDNWWVFIPQKHIYRRHHYVYKPRPGAFVGSTTIINHVYNRPGSTPYITGPKAEEVSGATGKNIDVYKIREAQQPGNVSVSGNEVELFHPGVSFVAEERLKPRPAKLIRNMYPTGREAQPVETSPAYRKAEMEKDAPWPRRQNETERQPQQPRPWIETERQRQPEQQRPRIETEKQRQPQPQQPRINEQPRAPQQTAPQRQPAPSRPATNEGNRNTQQPRQPEQAAPARR